MLDRGIIKTGVHPFNQDIGCNIAVNADCLVGGFFFLLVLLFRFLLIFRRCFQTGQTLINKCINGFGKLASPVFTQKDLVEIGKQLPVKVKTKTDRIVTEIFPAVDIRP